MVGLGYLLCHEGSSEFQPGSDRHLGPTNWPKIIDLASQLSLERTGVRLPLMTVDKVIVARLEIAHHDSKYQIKTLS
jgi:hypothetical protein